MSKYTAYAIVAISGGGDEVRRGEFEAEGSRPDIAIKRVRKAGYDEGFLQGFSRGQITIYKDDDYFYTISY